MRSGKPALVLTTGFDLWIGNTSDSQLAVEPGELFGFSTGAYEEVTVHSSLVDCFHWVNLKLQTHKMASV